MKIEKNIPIPTPRRKRNSYPFGNMEAGDSFFVSNEDGPSNMGSLYNIAKFACLANEGKFKARKVDGGFRIWRIS